MMRESPPRQWKNSTLNDLIRKIDKIGSADPTAGSDRLRSVRTQENIYVVEELVCSQEGQLRTTKSPTEIARETGISRSSVLCIVKKDLQLKTFRIFFRAKCNCWPVVCHLFLIHRTNTTIVPVFRIATSFTQRRPMMSSSCHESGNHGHKPAGHKPAGTRARRSRARRTKARHRGVTSPPGMGQKPATWHKIA